jgi:transposase
MSKVYSDAFIEQALTKVHSRGNRSLREIADDLHVNYYTIKNWIKRKSLSKLTASANREKRPQDWMRDEQLTALHETHGLDAEAVQAWCRARGLFSHHLEEWRAGFCAEPRAATADARELRIAQANNEKLQRDLDRKDKALAEAAALLLLQKKFNALWEDEVK